MEAMDLKTQGNAIQGLAMTAEHVCVGIFPLVAISPAAAFFLHFFCGSDDCHGAGAYRGRVGRARNDSPRGSTNTTARYSFPTSPALSHSHMMPSSDEGASLFVYGTLIHPHILARVLSGSLRTPSSEADVEHQQYAHLLARPAILRRYEIRRVRGQEYPAIVQHEQAEAPVRGIVVSGLTPAEIAHLDRFEGDEYVRVKVEATVPTSEEPVPNNVRSRWAQDKIQDILDDTLPTERVQALIAGTEPAEQVPVETYLWVAPQGDLEPRDGPRGPWEFSSFTKSKSSRWTGGQWSDHGGPDGLASDTQDSRPQTPSTPIPQGRAPTDGTGGFDEVRRTLEHGGGGSSSSFSTFSIPASDDPWADPPRTASARQTPSATENRGDNPWAISSLSGGGSSTADTILEHSTAASHPTSSHQPIPEGYPLELEGQDVPGYERFGKPVRRWFLHSGNDMEGGSDRRFLSFNNGKQTATATPPPGHSIPTDHPFLARPGSLGTCPKPVLESYLSLSKKAEECPDAFERRYIKEAMPKLRARVAKMVNVPSRELVMIRNTTAGTNAVIRGYPWEKDDYVIHLSTLYGAVSNTIQYVSDSNGLASPKRVVVDVTYPISHEELVKKFTETLEKSKSEGKRIKMASLEVITSRPGVRVPWEQLVKVCRDHGVLSLVDGAHSFGHVPLDLGSVQPDFFVSTVHKWAYTHRGAAFLHVPVRNQYLVPSNPTSWGYRSAADRKAHPEQEPGDDFL